MDYDLELSDITPSMTTNEMRLQRRQQGRRMDERAVTREDQSNEEIGLQTDESGLNDSTQLQPVFNPSAPISGGRNRTTSRRSRLRQSFARMRHRGAVANEGQRQRDEEELANEVIRDIVSLKSNVRGGLALLKGNQSLDIIRESGLSMRTKRRVLTDVRNEQSARIRRQAQGVVGRCTMWSASVSIRLQHLRQRVFEAIYGVNFWEDSIKTVEGHFGTSVGSYFRFLKWLFLLNIPIFLVCFSFVTIPQLVYDLTPMVRPRLDRCERESFFGWEILTGAGNFTCSPLYYGHYTNDTIEAVTGLRYNMPLAYILSIGAYFLVNLVVIAAKISSSYRANFIEGSGDLRCYFVNKVFAGWDFGVVDIEAAPLKKKSLRQEMGEYISLVIAKEKKKGNRPSRTYPILGHILTNIVVLGLLVGCGFLIHNLLQSDDDDGLEDVKSWRIFGELVVPIVITAILAFVPKIFSLLSLVEQYDYPQSSLYMTLFRSCCLYCVIVGNVLYYWSMEINCDEGDCKNYECWENKMGQELYKLVIMDFIVTLLDFLLTDFLRGILVKFVMITIFKRNRDRIQRFLPNFNVALNTLNLIYSQSLTWFGIFYSPLLPVVQLIKLVLVFYLKKITVLKNCAPFSRAWRGARIQTIFLIMLFVGYMVAVVILGCGIYLAKPSEKCGPYMGQAKVNDALLDFISAFYKEASALSHIISFLSSSWFIIAVIVFLSIQVYYARVSSIAKLETITMLKNQLQLSSYDKIFLLKQIQDNSRTSE